MGTTCESSHEARVSDLAILTRGTSDATAFRLLHLLPNWTADSAEEFDRLRSLQVGPGSLEGLSFLPDPFPNEDLVDFWNPQNTASLQSASMSMLTSREAPPGAYQLLASQFALAIDMPSYLEPILAMAIVECMAEFPEPGPEYFEQSNFEAHAQCFWQMNPRLRPDNAPPTEPEQLYQFNMLPDDGVEPRRYP